MKIIISNANDVEFETLVDLNRLIPEGIDGKILNYGQGEGQVLIGESVWGIYAKSENESVLQYENGLIDFFTLLALTSKIMDKLRREFSSDLEFKIEGMLESEMQH